MIRAAGAVVWRAGREGPEVALVHRPRYDDWSLPKGKLDAGEPHLVAAMREVEEETGVTGAARSSLGSTTYAVNGTPKTVRWWSLRAMQQAFVPSAEVDEVRWLAPDAVASLIGPQPPLTSWRCVPPNASVVVLVRHGRAGRRCEGSGPEDERPLDDVGQGQARLLARVVPAYQPVRLLTAPARRCLDTVAELAAALGQPAEVCASFGDVDALAMASALVEAAVPGEVIVVCSQGAAIEAAMVALRGRSGVRMRTGEACELTLVGDRVVREATDILD